jgi:hypothetical protein
LLCVTPVQATHFPEDGRTAEIVFRRCCLMRPDRSGGAGLRPARRQQCDAELLNELCRRVSAFSSPGECGRRGSSECSQQGVASDGVH